LFVLIAFYVVDDIRLLYKLVQLGYGFPAELGGNGWYGIVFRIIGPAALILIGVLRFRAKTKEMMALCLFGIARLLSFNSMALEQYLKLGLPAMNVTLLADVVGFYLSLMTFRESRNKGKGFPVREFLLKLLLVVGSIALVSLMGWIFFVHRK
jgi:hypothetical protein